MRRGYLLLLLLTFAATASAQQPFPDQVQSAVRVLALAQGQAIAPDVHASPDAMVARLMSFDRNSDGKVTKDELFERMENVIARGDANGDGALDAAEIRATAERPAAPIAARGFQAGHYGFSDESGLSSRLRIEGALEDLRLASPAKEEARAVVAAFAGALDKKAQTELLDEMATFLPPEQLAVMRTAVTRQLPVSQLLRADPNAKMIIIATDLRQVVEQFRLAEPQKSRAMAAVEWFKNRVRPGDVERTSLLAQLKDILTDDERDDFRAALERRPIAKSGGFVVFDGAVDLQSGPRIASVR